MSLAAAVRLPSSLHSLTVGEGPDNACDLRKQQRVTQAWFEGRPTYGGVRNASYPPASYALLWGLVGWSEHQTARWIWALLTLAALAALGGVAARAVGGPRWPDQAILFLLPLSTYGNAQSTWNGQLTPLVLAALGVSLLLLARPQRTWGRDVLLAAIFLVALVKPSLSAPFFWLVLLRRGGQRAALLIVLGYVGLTVLAAQFQHGSTISVFAHWVERAGYGIVVGATLTGYGSLSDLLIRLPWTSPSIHASLALLLVCGALVLVFHDRELWLVAGLVAIFARLWTYHAIYDDGVILFAMLGLAHHVQRRGTDAPARPADYALLLLLWLTSHAPVSYYYRRSEYYDAFTAVLTFTWLATLAYFLLRLRSAARQPPPSSPTPRADRAERAERDVERSGSAP